MGLSTPQGGERKPRPLVPIGPQAAILYGIIDLGTHVEVTQWGEKKKPKVMFLFEYPMLPKVTFDEAKGPQRMNQIIEYAFYSDEKSNLIKGLKSWRGVPKVDLSKDLPAYLGQACQIMIIQETSKRTGELISKPMNNGAIILPPTANFGPPENPIVFFDMDKFTWPAFHALYPFVQNKIKASLEWNTILQKHGAEPAVQQQAQPQQSFAQMGNVNQQMPQNTNFQQQAPIQNAAPQFQQQQMQQAPSFANPVQNVQAPQFHSGHGVNQPVSNVNTQQFAPQVNELSGTGIIVDNGTPPSF